MPEKTVRFCSLTKSMLLGTMVLTVLGSTAAQRPELVKDLNSRPVADPSSDPDSFATLGAVFVFAADAKDGKGRELYRSLGTRGSTRLLKDIAGGPASSDPRVLTATSKLVYFVADDGTNGRELWATDGTTIGTRLVKNVGPGSANGAYHELEAVGDTIYFVGDDGATGRELWKSDGTAAGTVLVKDIANGFVYQHPSRLTAFGGKLAFVGGDFLGLELWISDGTAAGTVQVKDIDPGVGSSTPDELTVIGPTLYFSADTPGFGRELWNSDGTAFGTRMIADISPGLSGSAPGAFASVGSTGIVLFRASDARGAELWRTDGTAGGTSLLLEIDPRTTPPFGPAMSSNPSHFTPLGGAVLFTATNALGPRVWRSDGTIAGTKLLANLTPFWHQGLPVQMGNHLLFRASGRGSPAGEELWKTDGTDAGTSLVKDIRPGSMPSSLRWLTLNASGRIVFSAYDGTTGSELWTTDGSNNGTFLVDNIAKPPAGHTFGSNPYELVDALGGTFFFANFDELWKTDGTSAGTVMLQKFSSANRICACPAMLTRVGDVLFFRVRSVIWKTDGTPRGTVAVKDIDPGSTGAWPADFTGMGGELYFSASDRRNGAGRELWKSDGTAAGTVMVADINPGSGGSFLGNFVATQRALLFSARDGSFGDELYRSDGTAAGTRRVKDINPGSASSNPRGLTRFAGEVFFRATTPTHGSELWKTDGTTGGTVLVQDVLAGSSGSSPSELTPAGDLLYFLGLRYSSGWIATPWRTDGTAAGTVPISPFETEHIVGFGDSALLFSGASVLRSQGTATSTTLVTRFAAQPPFFHAVASGSRYVWFTANQASTGTELYRSDGTPAGTRLVVDMNRGSSSSDPRELVLSRGRVYFAVDDGRTGHELWRLFPDASSQSIGTGCAAGSSWPEIRSDDPVLGSTMTITGRGAAPAVPTWIVAGIGPTVRLLGGGCEAYLVSGTEVLVGPFTPNASGWDFRAPLPNAAVFLGVTAVIQVVQSPTNGPLGLDLTNGVALTFGM